MIGSHAPAPPAPPSLAAFLRRHDPDRYFCTLFAPAQHRETLFTLYAFNHELARACDVTREPGLALIRLHWWREVVEGEGKNHEVATPLHAALGQGRLQAPDLLAMIDARDREAEADFATMTDWEDWLRQGAGSLAVAAGRALGAPDALHPSLCLLGAGIGAAGQLRNIDACAAQGRCLLPGSLLASHKLTPEAVIVAPRGAAVAPVRAAIAAAADRMLGPPHRWPPTLMSAALPAVLARRDLRGGVGRPRGLGDRMAVLLARRA